MNCLSNVIYRFWTQKGHLNFKLRSQRAFNNPNLGLGNLDPRSHPTDDRSISTYRARMHVRVHPKYTCLPTVRRQSAWESFLYANFPRYTASRLGYNLALVNLWWYKLHTATSINDRGVSISFTYEINLIAILPPSKSAQLQDS